MWWRRYIIICLDFVWTMSGPYRRYILITGATDGIGKETARQLATNPENFVIVHGRNADRCKETLKEIGQTSDRHGCVVADFASLKSIPLMVAEVAEKFPLLNVVICNAGVLLPNRQLSADGVEMTFQVNHLAHFSLIHGLLPQLKRNVPSRIIVVSSICYSWHSLDWDDLEAKKDYEKYVQYSRTKLANHLMAFKLARLLSGTGVTSNVLEPGVIQTKLLAAGGFSGAPVQQGAVASVFLAQDDSVEKVTGSYFSNVAKKLQPTRESGREDFQDRLWDISEEMCQRLGGVLEN